MTELPSAADAAMLARGLAEILADDAPPDLTARVRGASAARRAAAAQAVAAASPLRWRSPWLAAAVVLLAATAVAGVFVQQRAEQALTAGQEPRAVEVVPADAAELAALLPGVEAITLIARSTADGARLPDLPEHAEVLADPALRQQCVAALATLVDAPATEPPFALAEAQGELLLHLTGRRHVRCRLRFPSNEGADLGTAKFSRCGALSAGLAAAVRDHWQRLASAAPRPRQKIQVSTTKELVAAIGSDRTIELIGGPFVLDPQLVEDGGAADAAFSFAEGFGGATAQIRGVHNLHLRAVGDRVRVLGTSPDEVLGLRNCEGVRFEGLVLGHIEGLSGSCSAPVLVAEDCRGLWLRDCDLFGCGTDGMIARQVHDVVLERCAVHTCSAGVVQFHGCTDLRFTATSFRDCAMLWGEGGFVFRDCARVAFRDCEVTRMRGDGVGDGGPPMFGIQMDEAISFQGGAIVGNRCARIATSKLLLVREGVVERDNGPDVVVEPAPK